MQKGLVFLSDASSTDPHENFKQQQQQKQQKTDKKQASKQNKQKTHKNTATVVCRLRATDKEYLVISTPHKNKQTNKQTNKMSLVAFMPPGKPGQN